MSCKKNDRYKDWLFLLWEDNHYSDYMSRLSASGVQCAISPLHANDSWEYNDDMIDDPRVGVSPDLRDYNLSLGENGGTPGSSKKPHRHIILRFPGSKSQEQVNQFVSEIFSERPCLPMKCWGISGATRYLIHYDHPHKEQFTIHSIISVNGFDFEKYFKPTAAQEDELFYSVLTIIEQNNFNTWYRLMFYLSNQCKNGDYIEEFRYCRSHVHLISTFVNSRQAIEYASSDAVYRSELLKQLNKISQTIKEKK